MANNWYPGANTSIRHPSKGVPQDARYPARGVLHTTETQWLPSYAAPSAPPHFTVMANGRVYQHMPVNEVSGALRNVYPGHRDQQYDTGIDPDRTGRLNVQIETVGYARQDSWPEAQVSAILALWAWLEEEHGLPARFADVEFDDGASYGYRNEHELTLQEWLDLNAWVGHQHVPENTHWDPGDGLPRLIKERTSMALSPEVEEFVNQMYLAAEAAQDGDPNGFLIGPVVDLVYKEREDPALRESDRASLETTQVRRHRHRFRIEGTTENAS